MAMSLTAPPPDFARARPWWKRLPTFLKTAYDAFAEAQELARAAHRRYPFIDW